MVSLLCYSQMNDLAKKYCLDKHYSLVPVCDTDVENQFFSFDTSAAQKFVMKTDRAGQLRWQKMPRIPTKLLSSF